MAKVGIMDVARHTGASVGTVGNALDRPGRGAEPTWARVRSSKQALRCVRDESARQLRSGTSRTTIGLLVLDTAHPFCTDIAQGVETTADGAGHMVSPGNSGQDSRRESRLMEPMLEQRTRGDLVSPVGASPSGPALLAGCNIPVMVVDRAVPSAARSRWTTPLAARSWRAGRACASAAPRRGRCSPSRTRAPTTWTSR